MISLKFMYIPLTYKKFYNKENPDIDTLKSRLSKFDKQILVKCALTLLHNADSWANINGFISHFFSSENEKFAYEIRHRVDNIISELHMESNEVIPQISILTKHSCLEFMRIIFSVRFTGENIIDNALLQLDIFNCLLVINDITTPTPNFPDNMDNNLKLAYGALLNMSSYNDFTNINTKANFIIQCYKSKILFEFLDSQDNLKIIKNMYLKDMGCKSWEEYIFVLSKLFVINNQDKLPITSIVLDENDHYFQHDKILFLNSATL